MRGREIIFSCTQRRRKEDGLGEEKKLRLKGSLKRGADGREERRRQIQNPWIHPREKKTAAGVWCFTQTKREQMSRRDIAVIATNPPSRSLARLPLSTRGREKKETGPI